MNFFQQQDQARRQTRWLVFLFILAVLAIVAAVDLVLLIGFGAMAVANGQTILSPQGLTANLQLLAGGAVATAAVIGFGSLFKTAALKSGGGKVARDLGGTLVDSATRDPMRRRLCNVVEEIALASGVPVPEIYVLEQESGINAFAAGFTSSDAAVAVTRGAMEKLSRSELQGVIAHEFSHIHNGDMRLNIRLMGVLFGILMLSLIGRKVLYHGRHMGRSKDNGGAAILFLALTLTVVGYIGLFFGRWIKSAVSRQREFLADASAVQFTRDPDSFGGALKKIAVYSDASYLEVESEEVGHMLFGSGRKMHLFATHPPLLTRIQRIEPGFHEDDLKLIADRILRDERRLSEEEERHAQKAAGGAQGAFDASRIMDEIGNPGWDRLLVAAAIAASIPEPVRQAAHVLDRAPAVLLYTLLDGDAEIRERQLLEIVQSMGGDVELHVRGLLKGSGLPEAEQRLPLMEITLPAIKRQAPDFIKKLLQTMDRLIHIDGRVDVFEFLLARVISQYLWESVNPHSVKTAGHRHMAALGSDAALVMAVLARYGHDGVEDARAAYDVGMAQLELKQMPAMPVTDNWTEAMDMSLDRLDQLRHGDKELLARAMIETVTADGRLVAAELELMRAVCAALHIPVPMISEVREI